MRRNRLFSLTIADFFWGGCWIGRHFLKLLFSFSVLFLLAFLTFLIHEARRKRKAKAEIEWDLRAFASARACVLLSVRFFNLLTTDS